MKLSFIYIYIYISHIHLYNFHPIFQRPVLSNQNVVFPPTENTSNVKTENAAIFLYLKLIVHYHLPKSFLHVFQVNQKPGSVPVFGILFHKRELCYCASTTRAFAFYHASKQIRWFHCVHSCAPTRPSETHSLNFYLIIWLRNYVF